MTRAVPWVVALLVLVVRVLPVSDPDYHWHLATGRWIVAHRSVPAVDVFSHTAAGRPWIFVDWVSDVAMYALHRLGGDALVTVMFALLGALSVAVTLDDARRRAPDARAVHVAAVATILASVVAFRTTPRPQTATFLLLSVLLVVLERGRERPRALVAAPLVIAGWQNIHSSAPLGVAVVLAYVVGEIVDRGPHRRAFALAGVASAAALLFAVRPIARLRAGFDHLGDPRVAELFPEWGPAVSGGVFGAWVIAALLLLALAALSGRRATGALLATLGLGLVGLLSVRFLPLAAIAAAPLALRGLQRIARARVVDAVALVAAAALFAPRVQRPGFGLAAGAFPERAARFASEHGLSGKLFNEFHYGGYLIWTLGERAPVFIDGRSMALYGVAFTYEASAAIEDGLLRMVDARDVSMAIVPPDRRMGTLQRKPGWSLLFFDDVGAVLVRARDFPALDGLTYRAIAPGRWFDIEPLRRDPERLALAVREAERARREAPDSSLAAVTEIAVAVAAGDVARADALLAEAQQKFPPSQRLARAKLVRCLGFGEVACACDAARAIARDYPGNSYTAATLTALRCP